MFQPSNESSWGKPRRYSRRRIWLVPALWVTLAIVMGVILSRVNLWGIDPGFAINITPGVEVPVLSSISSGMMALTGIVFSMAFLFVQFGSSAYSPRLVSLFTTDRVLTHALGIFTGTFVFALVGLMLLTPDRSPFLTWTVSIAALCWLLASIALFILLVQRINRLTISNVLHMLGEAGRRVIESMYPALDDPTTVTKDSRNDSGSNLTSSLPPVTQTLRYVGGPSAIVEFQIPVLVELARGAGAILEINYAVGDFVADSSVVLNVRGAQNAISEPALRAAIVLGFERTIEQDPKYALRLLVDVGIKALSPAVNDPTTAVMALNELDDLLGRIGRRKLDVGYAYDNAGAFRLIYPTPTWQDFLSLAIDEIRFYGTNSYQVMRRLRAMLTDLEQVVPPERAAAIREHIRRLDTVVEKSFEDASDLNIASQSDRQGIGLARASDSKQAAATIPNPAS